MAAEIKQRMQSIPTTSVSSANEKKVVLGKTEKSSSCC
jgi:hypothetical protein